MTFSNGTYNPDPLANPFNTRLGPSNYTLNPNGVGNPFCKMTFSKKTELPKPVMLGQQQSLQLPQQQISMKDFLQIEMSRYANGRMDWKNEDIYRMPTSPKENGMTKKDIEYWKHAEEESKKLEANMSDEQKEMLADLDKIFPPSKLEDCDD